METPPGLQGYADAVDNFIAANESISFDELHQCILDWLPSTPSAVLDIGCGSGRDAAALAKAGHSVMAVEPMTAFIESAKRTHRSDNIEWLQDSLPNLSLLPAPSRTFAFILCHGVWQHLDQTSRLSALARISDLLTDNGSFALALRHGPAGQGTYYHPADTEQTIADAATFNLHLVRKLENQASIIPGKPGITWTRLVFSYHQ